jgi:phage terminase large subunit GpA-like protein
LTVSELANGRRILSPETGNEPGPYYVDRAYYQKEPQDVFDNEPWIRERTFMFASRMGKSTIIENGHYKRITRGSGNILDIFPTDKKGKRWAKISLEPFIRDNPPVKEMMPNQKIRSKENEIQFKQYKFGVIVIGGANVPDSLSTWSMEEVNFDEVDEFPPFTERQGDPIENGKQRAENFPNKQFTYASTPTIRGASRIEEAWNESDQRLYFVPCPFCRHKQILIFSPRSHFAHLTAGYLKYEYQGTKVTKAVYVCGNSVCKKEIPEKYKTWMVRNGEWRKMNPVSKYHAGFHINRLYSPWSHWTEIAEFFLRTEKRPERLRAFVNKALGETYIENINYQFNDDEMLKRCEPYENIPAGVVIMTVGVDVQDDRLEAILYGWGKNEECWFIERGIITGSPEDDTTWHMLDEWILRQRKHENGFMAQYGKVGGILAVAIDSGHMTNVVNTYVAARKRNRFFAVKGASKPQKDFVQMSRNKKKRDPLILVDTFQGKKKIYFRLNIERQKNQEGRNIPTPQYMHFNMSCNKEFFEQLTSNQVKIKRIDGHPRQVFELPSGKQDEVLDCTDYALAALHAIVPGGSKNVDPFLNRLADALAFKMQSFVDSHPERSSEGTESKGADIKAEGVETTQSPLIAPKKKKKLTQIRIKL